MRILFPAHHMIMKTVPSALTLLMLVLSLSAPGMAQIIGSKQVNGKTVWCAHSGLSSDLRDCGAPEWYAYVFIGSISTIAPAANDEKKIQIVPEEIFKGEPPSPLAVLTSQAGCLPGLNVGDRWLFFLRKEGSKPVVLDYYGNDSRPVVDAKDEIETLRRLKTIGEFGILRGSVMKGRSFEGRSVPHASVVAHSISDNSQFATTTDQDGRYEFPPLPSAKYKLTVDPIGSFRPDDSQIEIRRGGCWDLTLLRYPHARLGGHLQRSDGSPLPGVAVLLTDESEEWWMTSKTDARGHFVFDSQPAGKYLVGIDVPHAGAWQNTSGGGPRGSAPKASLYYPGVQNRDGALAIALSEDEKRDDIDFVVPMH